MTKIRLVVAATGVVMLGLGGSVAAAASAGPGHTASAGAGAPTTPGSVLPPDHAWTVTLITGDVVRVRTQRGGPPLVVVLPRPGRGNVIFSKFVTASGQIEVLPQDVVPLLGRVLDPALFDVTTLIANGDDNAHRSYLSLIVQGAAGRAAAREPLAGLTRFGRALDAMAAAVVRAGRVTPLATRGIRHIWLAQSLRAIAAPPMAAPTVTLTLKAIPIPGTAHGQMGAIAYVVNIGNPNLFDRVVPINFTGGTNVRVPAGRYWISGVISDFNPIQQRAAWAGQPELAISKNTTVTLDGAATVPVTGSVAGHPTVMTSVGFHVDRRFAKSIFGGLGGGDVFAFGPNVAHDLFAEPTGALHTGTFHVYTDFQLSSPAGTARPYVYDVYHPVGTRVPRSLAYTASPAEQATFARLSERFHAVDGNTTPVQDIRFGLTPTSFAKGNFTVFLTVEDAIMVASGSSLTEYVSTGPGISWSEEVAPSLTGQNLANLWVIEVPGFTRYAAGSRHVVDWVLQPFRPGPYSGTMFSASGCAPHPTVRSAGDIHVELVDLQDLPDGFDCLAGLPPWPQVTSRTMRLYRGSQLIGSMPASVADFSVPAAAATYKLVYTDNTSRALPVSTQTQTTWTFRSAAPAGSNAVRIPLLLVDYALPLGLDNHPNGSTAVFTVARVAGTPGARVTGFALWTSLGNGHTWQAAPVRSLGGGRFSATLPHAARGQAVSLRVRATDAGGSRIEQTILTAYHG